MGSGADDGAAVRAQRCRRGVDAGLGRALGETVAILIILRASAHAGHWSLFDGGYTFASKIASAASEFSEALPTGAYISAGFVLFVLTFIVNAVARAIVGRVVTGDQHEAQPTGQGGSASPCQFRRRIKNHVARLAFPLVVRDRGCTALATVGCVLELGTRVDSPGWWSHSLRGVLPEQFSGGEYHAVGPDARPGGGGRYPCRTTGTHSSYCGVQLQ